MTILLFIAIAIVVVGSLGARSTPSGVQRVFTPLLFASILYILVFLARVLINPLAPNSEAIAVALLVVVIVYGGRRFWGLIVDRRNP